MRLSSHLSSSTFSTGTLEAARVNPSLRRRIASSRPRRCGSETTRGAGMIESFLTQPHVVPHFPEGATISAEGTRRNFPGSRLFFQSKAAQQWQLPGWRRCQMSIGLIILIILIIALLGGFSGIGGGPFYGTGYYGGGGPWLICFILLIFLLPCLSLPRNSLHSRLFPIGKLTYGIAHLVHTPH